MYVPLPFIVLPIASRLTRLWLDENLDVDTLNKSLPGNVTVEMGLMIGDLADTARKYPKVVDYLERSEDSTFYQDTFYQGLSKVKGGDIFGTELDRFMLFDSRFLLFWKPEAFQSLCIYKPEALIWRNSGKTSLPGC